MSGSGWKHTNNKCDTVPALRVGSLFSGVGGLDLAVESFFQAETVWQCEVDPEPSKVLEARWPGVPNLGDVTAVKWTPDCPSCGDRTALYWRHEVGGEREYYCSGCGWWPLSIRFDDPAADRIPEPVDIACGGFPCQDLSLAGRRAGMRPGTRSGLWADFRKAIEVLKPSVVVIENVRGLLSGCGESESDSELGRCPRCVDPGSGVPHAPNIRALGRVLGDLHRLGFDAEWHGLLASDVGAPHGRFRVFILAYARGVRLGEGWGAASRRLSGGGASAEFGGRADTPVRLLPTPTTAPDTGNGHARNLGTEVKLLPTPDASNANDGEDVGSWLARRERVKATANNGNGIGMPLAIAVKMLPTPQVADAMGGHATRSGARSDELLLPGVAVAAQAGRLLPTPISSDANGAQKSEAVARESPQLRAIGQLLTTPRASRGASSTETMCALGAGRDDTGDRQGNVVGTVAWGEYAPAVRRWESITRPAPAPTLPDGRGGAHRLAAVFSEWMMGFDSGWITDVIGRNSAIRAAGNSVCPQQAFAALGVLWARVVSVLTDEEGADQ